MRQHRAEEFRLNFKVMVGLERTGAAWADVMQHENGAHARENRPQQVVCPGEVKRFKPGADHGVAELAHRVVKDRLNSDSTLARDR